MRKWITCTIMAVMMAAMIFMGTGNNVFANDEVTYDSNMQTKKFDVDVKVGEDGSYTVTEISKSSLSIRGMEFIVISHTKGR